MLIRTGPWERLGRCMSDVLFLEVICSLPSHPTLKLQPLTALFRPGRKILSALPPSPIPSCLDHKRTITLAKMAKISPSTNPSVESLTSYQRSRHLRKLQGAMPNATQRSRLLDLPPELRNRIYQFVLIHDGCIDVLEGTDGTGITTRQKTKARPRKAVVKEPGLLRSCSIVRNEASQMYYALNIFTCSINGRLSRWVEGLGTRKQAMLKDVRVRLQPRLDHKYGDSKLPRMLIALRSAESEARIRGFKLGENVLRISADQVAALSASEIEARMTTQEQQRYNRQEVSAAAFTRTNTSRKNVGHTCYWVQGLRVMLTATASGSK